EEAGSELLALAEMLQAPVVSVTSGKGIISDRHYLSVAGPLGHRLWADADVVLAVGTRLQRTLTGWGVDPALKLIRVDVDPVEIERMHHQSVGIAADARLALASLREVLASSNHSRAQHLTDLSSLIDKLY